MSKKVPVVHGVSVTVVITLEQERWLSEEATGLTGKRRSYGRAGKVSRIVREAIELLMNYRRAQEMVQKSGRGVRQTGLRQFKKVGDCDIEKAELTVAEHLSAEPDES